MASLALKLWPYGLALAVLLAAMGLAYSAGVRQSAQECAAKQLDSYKATVERAGNADISSGDLNADREWLRKRNQR